MSSTKRGGQRSPSDNYPTPGWCFRRFLDKFLADHPDALNVGAWLEPGAGEGNLVRTANEWFEDSAHKSPEWDVNELREECVEFLDDLDIREITISDFLDNGDLRHHQYDVVITNPPFSLTMQFIEAALRLNTRYVVMLQRLNYIGTERRHAFMQANPPDLYVLPNRPSFKATGETDSVEYAWMVWDTRNLRRAKGEYVMLSLTPKEERKNDHARVVDLGIFPEPEPEPVDPPSHYPPGMGEESRRLHLEYNKLVQAQIKGAKNGPDVVRLTDECSAKGIILVPGGENL